MHTPQKPLKWYRNLATRKGRLEAGAFVVEGNRAINQIIASRPGEIIEILAVEEPPPPYRNYAMRLLTEKQFAYVSSNRTPQGIMAVVRMPVDIYSGHLPDDAGSKILLLEDVQDPGNVGTLIRTAAAFNFSGVVLTEKCADPLAPKCVQASAGAILSLWLRKSAQYLEIASNLRKRNFPLIAADLKGTAEPSILSHQSRLILALGNEAAGLSQALLEMADYRVRIPTAREKAESLNVAACGAICMYLSPQI